MRFSIIIAIAACLILAGPARAQMDAQATRIQTPLRGTVAGFAFKCRGDRSYPDIEARSDREGWIDLRFTAKADGSIKDIEVMSTFGSERFVEAATLELARCRISNPQQENGVPVDTANVPMRFTYRIEPMLRGGTPGIVEQMRQVQELTAAGDLDAAEAVLDKIEANGTRLYEITHALSRRAIIMAKRGQPDVALRYLRYALKNAYALTPEDRASLLRARLRLELALGLAADADDTAQKMEKEEIDLKSDPQLDGLIRLRTLAQSNQPMAVSGRIPTACRPFICDMAQPDWSYTPTHRTLSLTDVKGRVDTVSIRCDRKTYSTKAAADVTWTIPAKWGNCRFSVSGEPGTTFTLVDETPSG